MKTPYSDKQQPVPAIGRVLRILKGKNVLRLIEILEESSVHILTRPLIQPEKFKPYGTLRRNTVSRLSIFYSRVISEASVIKVGPGFHAVLNFNECI